MFFPFFHVHALLPAFQRRLESELHKDDTQAEEKHCSELATAANRLGMI
jgi:hypothetical protein